MFRFALVLVFAMVLMNVRGAVYYVSNTGSSTNSGTDPTSPFLEMSDALSAASANGDYMMEVNVFPGTYGGDGNIGLTYSMATSIYNYGDGAVIFQCDTTVRNQKGFESQNNFTMIGDSISINDCKWGINAQGNSTYIISLQLVTFSGNYVGLSVDNGFSVNINNCIFEDQTLGIAASGKSYSSENATFRMQSSSFNGCGLQVESFEIGSLTSVEVYNFQSGPFSPISLANGGSSGATMAWTLFQVNVHDSNASGFGGGIGIIGPGDVNITQSQVINCSSQAGGGISVHSANTILIDILVENCSASSAGGGFFQRGGLLDMSHVKFSDCSSVDGGAMDLEGAMQATLTDVNCLDNTATDNGSCLACCTSKLGCNIVVEDEGIVYTGGNSGVAPVSCLVH